MWERRERDRKGKQMIRREQQPKKTKAKWAQTHSQVTNKKKQSKECNCGEGRGKFTTERLTEQHPQRTPAGYFLTANVTRTVGSIYRQTPKHKYTTLFVQVPSRLAQES